MKTDEELKKELIDSMVDWEKEIAEFSDERKDITHKLIDEATGTGAWISVFLSYRKPHTDLIFRSIDRSREMLDKLEKKVTETCEANGYSISKKSRGHDVYWIDY